MSYEVDNRSEVKDRLEDFERQDGIDSVGDIRRAHGSRRHRIAATGDAAHLGLQADAAPGQLAADYAALAGTHRELSGQLGVIDGLIRQASRLARPMNDGHGPIAYAMRLAFNERADDADGAVQALRSYRAELGNVVDAIARTMAQYQVIDSTLAQQLAGVGEQHA